MLLFPVLRLPTGTALLLLGILVGISAAAPLKSSAKAKAIAPHVAATSTTLLDSAKVRKYYLDGEFEAAILILETGLQENRRFNHNDSVFIYKHLGVMYAARYETREKGKFYMHQLLMTEPTAKIMDMYASDMIYMIFKNMQDEFESNRVRLDHAEELVRGNQETGPSKRDSIPAVARKAPESGKAWMWVGAGAAVVGAGIGAFFMFSDEPQTVTRNSQF